MAVLSNLKYLIASQFFSRGVTFSMNLFVARKVGPVVFGLASVNLYLLYTLILFVSREGLRRAVMRVPTSSQLGRARATAAGCVRQRGQIINLAWAEVCFALPVALVVGRYFLTNLPPALSEAVVLLNDQSQLPESTTLESEYKRSVKLCVAAALIEMCCEPLAVFAQWTLQVRTRVLIEAAATALRCAVTFGLVIGWNQGLIAFAHGQLVYSVAVVCLFYGSFVQRRLLKAAKEGDDMYLPLSEMFPHRLPLDPGGHYAAEEQGAWWGDRWAS